MFIQSSIQWREVSLSDTSCELLVESLDTYLFGVAVNAITWAGARISSGIRWNSCVYIKNLSKNLHSIQRHSCKNASAYTKICEDSITVLMDS